MVIFPFAWTHYFIQIIAEVLQRISYNVYHILDSGPSKKFDLNSKLAEQQRVLSNFSPSQQGHRRELTIELRWLVVVCGRLISGVGC